MKIHQKRGNDLRERNLIIISVEVGLDIKENTFEIYTIFRFFVTYKSTCLGYKMHPLWWIAFNMFNSVKFIIKARNVINLHVSIIIWF